MSDASPHDYASNKRPLLNNDGSPVDSKSKDVPNAEGGSIGANDTELGRLHFAVHERHDHERLEQTRAVLPDKLQEL